MEVKSVLGDPLFTVLFSGITASMGIPANLLTLPVSPDDSQVRTLKFTGGGTNTPAAGETVTGLTSAATARIVAVALVSGTFADGTAAGVLFVDRQSGTFAAENLDHTNGATDDMTIAENSKVLPCPGFKCRGAVLTVETADVRFVEDGTIVTVTGGVNPGTIIGTTSQPKAIEQTPDKLKFINATNGNNGVLNATLFY